MKSKQQKREEAEQRNAYYRSLHHIELIDHMLGKPGHCARECERIIEKRKKENK